MAFEFAKALAPFLPASEHPAKSAFETAFFASSACRAWLHLAPGKPSLQSTLSKQWFVWSGTYGVEIAEGEDDIRILASTAVIDMACHGDQQRR